MLRSPQLLHDWLVRQRLPQRVHSAAERLVGKQALQGRQSRQIAVQLMECNATGGRHSLRAADGCPRQP